MLSGVIGVLACLAAAQGAGVPLQPVPADPPAVVAVSSEGFGIPQVTNMPTGDGDMDDGDGNWSRPQHWRDRHHHHDRQERRGKATASAEGGNSSRSGR